MIEIHDVKNNEEMELTRSIRKEVFVVEQGISEEIEIDGLDGEAFHVVAYMDGEPAGCGRMLYFGDEAKIGRVAVRKEMRGRGIGTGICKYMMAIAKEKGIKKVFADAQLDAVGFYLGLGFSKTGNVFMEAGIRHIRVSKIL